MGVLSSYLAIYKSISLHCGDSLLIIVVALEVELVMLVLTSKRREGEQKGRFFMLPTRDGDEHL